MDNDDAIVGRILTRRDALRLAARAGMGLALAGPLVRSAFGATAVPSTQPKLPVVVAPELTEGPFFVDEKLNRSDLVAGTKRPAVVNGMPLALALTVYTITGKTYAPLKNVTIDLWHADASGHYSDENNPLSGENTAGEKWLRGYQTTGDDGQVRFNTIFPGWYGGRSPHIHFKVRMPAADEKSTREFDSQLFFHNADIDRVYAKLPYDAAQMKSGTRNEDDAVYNGRLADGTPAGSHMLLDLVPDPAGNGQAANFVMVLTDQSLRSGRWHFRWPAAFGGRPADGPPNGPPDGPGGPPDLSLEDWLNGGPDFGPPPGPPSGR